MATVETLQNLRLITRLYFRVLRWRIQNEYFKEYAKFYMVREELQALGIRTVKELKLFDEGSWTEYISRVKWDREQFGQKGILYREDLFRQREVGDLEHIPGKAEVNRIYFKNPRPIPEISIVEQLQELRIDIESNISGDILAMCKWPGLPLFEQCKNSNDVIQLINSKRQNPKDVLKKMIYVQGNYLSCFRMLKRVVKHKTQQIPKTTSGKAVDKIRKQFLTLKSFIEIHCDLSARPDVQSKVALLHEYNLKGKIKLPKLAHKYRKGQHKYYYVDDLKKNWPTYQKKMPTLPPLVVGN